MIRRTVRAATVLFVAAPTMFAFVAIAPPAFAAADGTLYVDQSVATTASNPTATVSLAKRCNALGQSCNGDGRLTIVRPDGASVLPDGRTGGSQTVKSTGSNYTYTIEADTVRNSVRNGTWTLTLVDSAGGQSTRTFVSDFTPVVPSNVGAQGSGTNRVDVWWNKGPEPDLTGFEINDGQGNLKTVDLGACSGSSCAVALSYDNATPGTYDYSFTVRSLRNSGQAGRSDLRSAASKTANAQLVTPQPSPTPTTSPTPGASPGPTGSPAPGQSGSPKPGAGTGTGTGGGSTGAGGAPTKPGAAGSTPAARPPVLSIPRLSPILAQRRAFALNFNTFSPSMGIPKLPPLPATVFAEPDEGTFAPTLPYSSPEAQASGPTDVLSSPIAAVTSLDTAQLAKSLAFALLLLGAAAHLRLFLRVQDDD